MLNTAYGCPTSTDCMHWSLKQRLHLTMHRINNASDYRDNGLLSDYIGWTNGLTAYRANGLTD